MANKLEVHKQQAKLAVALHTSTSGVTLEEFLVDSQDCVQQLVKRWRYAFVVDPLNAYKMGK